MTTPSLAESRAQWRDVLAAVLGGLSWLLFAAGWLVAKTLRLLGTAVAGVLFAAGWAARKAGPWCVAAFREGWDAAGKPIGGRRGPA